jgi:maltose O-acetyltransferase
MHSERLTELSVLGGRLWRAGKEETSIDGRKLCVGVISRVFPHLSFGRTRTALLRAAGIRIGARSLVLGPIKFTGPGDAGEMFSVGDDTYITGPLRVDLGAGVRIGHRVQIGHDVAILTLDHEIGPPERRCGRLIAAPIEIGDGVWLGTNVTLLPGVEIGAGAIVGTGAVVSKDVAPNTLVGGVPAQFVRDLADEAPLSQRRGRAVLAGRG